MIDDLASVNRWECPIPPQFVTEVPLLSNKQSGCANLSLASLQSCLRVCDPYLVLSPESKISSSFFSEKLMEFFESAVREDRGLLACSGPGVYLEQGCVPALYFTKRFLHDEEVL